MKMSLRKRLLYSCIAMFGAVCLAQVGVNAQSFMQASEKIPNYERIFYATENAVLADNVVVDTIGASGVKVTALKNSTTLDFKHNFYGNFDLGFSIVPLQTGEYDFSSLQFTFTETKTGKYFDVCYQIKEVEGVISGEFAVKIPHRTSRYVAKTSDVSLTGEGERFESFEFNPYTMEVYYSYGGNKTKAVSLKDENLFLSFFNTHETYDSFEAYNVSMTFNGLKKESASVVLASLCGQNLGGTQLMNTAGAVIGDMPSIQNGVVGKALALPTKDIRTFDILDGEQKGFKGEITVKDPLGNTVFVENNTFIPNVAGEYMISYTPRDAEDMVGKPITQSVTVYSKAPVLSLEYEFALTDGYSISKNNVVLLPAAKGNSALINDDSRYEAFVSVTVAGDKILENVSVDESYILTFPKTGTAEIVYATSDFYGQKYEEKFSLNILESGVDFSALQFDRTQTLGDTVKLPTLSVGDTVVYPIVQYPDGRTVQGAYAKLDVSGAYSLYYNVENSEYYLDFTVEQTQKGLFDYDKNITATDGYSAPDYADANYQGLLLTANANNATAVYNKPSDLSKKTQSDLLLEFFLCPEKMGDY